MQSGPKRARHAKRRLVASAGLTGFDGKREINRAIARGRSVDASRVANAGLAGQTQCSPGSPSCGSSFIYDGSFAGRRLAGAGVTAAPLRQHGVEVFADTDIDALAARLAQPSPAE